MPVRTPSRRKARPGTTVCRRCAKITDGAHLVEMVRPGATRGVWWCEHCAAEHVQITAGGPAGRRNAGSWSPRGQLGDHGHTKGAR